jgi:two-component system response regulator RstA
MSIASPSLQRNFSTSTLPAAAMTDRPSHKDSNKTILLLTTDEQDCGPLIDSLVEEDFTVRLLKKKHDLLSDFPSSEAEMVILNSGKFSLEELSTLPRIRAVYTGLLMLLINNIDEMLQVLLYEQGVDDLLVKPVNHLLMVARIRALLRRSQLRATPANLNFNGLEINQGLRRASYLGDEIPLTSREFDLLWHLAKHACNTLDRDHLYKALFGIEYNGYDRSIDMYIARIRAKISHYPDLASMIKTVRGTGYLFAAEQ